MCKKHSKIPLKNYTRTKKGKNLAVTAFRGGYRGRNCDKESSHVVDNSPDMGDSS